MKSNNLKQVVKQLTEMSRHKIQQPNHMSSTTTVWIQYDPAKFIKKVQLPSGLSLISSLTLQIHPNVKDWNRIEFTFGIVPDSNYKVNADSSLDSIVSAVLEQITLVFDTYTTNKAELYQSGYAWKIPIHNDTSFTLAQKICEDLVSDCDFDNMRIRNGDFANAGDKIYNITHDLFLFHLNNKSRNKDATRYMPKSSTSGYVNTGDYHENSKIKAIRDAYFHHVKSQKNRIAESQYASLNKDIYQQMMNNPSSLYFKEYFDVVKKNTKIAVKPIGRIYSKIPFDTTKMENICKKNMTAFTCFIYFTNERQKDTITFGIDISFARRKGGIQTTHEEQQYNRDILDYLATMLDKDTKEITKTRETKLPSWLNFEIYLTNNDAYAVVTRICKKYIGKATTPEFIYDDSKDDVNEPYSTQIRDLILSIDCLTFDQQNGLQNIVGGKLQSLYILYLGKTRKVHFEQNKKTKYIKVNGDRILLSSIRGKYKYSSKPK